MQSVDALRTQEQAFAHIPDFPYEPNYVESLRGFGGLRMAYVDEGPRDASTVFFCVHGAPTWSFLYRKMIPAFLASGGRVVAPDLFGFGRSDKPVEPKVHTFRFHYDALVCLIEHLDLRGITLVVQGLGGMIGLAVPPEMPTRFARLLAMNTTLIAGDIPLGNSVVAWRAFLERERDLDVTAFMQAAVPHLNASEVDAYRAPFPEQRYKAVLPMFSRLIPGDPSADGALLARRARAWWRLRWSGPTYLAFGAHNALLGGPEMEYLRSVIRDAPRPVAYPDAGFFLPEWGDAVACDALAAFARYEPAV